MDRGVPSSAELAVDWREETRARSMSRAAGQVISIGALDVGSFIIDGSVLSVLSSPSQEGAILKKWTWWRNVVLLVSDRGIQRSFLAYIQARRCWRELRRYHRLTHSRGSIFRCCLGRWM